MHQMQWMRSYRISSILTKSGGLKSPLHWKQMISKFGKLENKRWFAKPNIFCCRVSTILLEVSSLRDQVVSHRDICSHYTGVMMELRASFNFMQALLDSLVDTSAVFSTWLKNSIKCRMIFVSLRKRLLHSTISLMGWFLWKTLMVIRPFQFYY